MNDLLGRISLLPYRPSLLTQLLTLNLGQKYRVRSLAVVAHRAAGSGAALRIAIGCTAGVRDAERVALASGLTGTGGGIFLSPLAIFKRWTTIRQVSGTAALFIFANSLAGLLGNFSAVKSLPVELPGYALAVMIGALIGTRLGLRKFDIRGLRVALALVLFIAGGKFLLG